tara:strand:+ start:161 stop:817 length:657 start_codon:yes stop_codon:yes gene_type:complete
MKPRNLFGLVLTFGMIANAALAATGSVTLKATQKLVDDSGMNLVETAYVNGNVFLDGNHPFGSGQIAGVTDSNGEFTIELEEGSHTVIFSKWTSSHSVFATQAYEFEVDANGQVEHEFKFVATRATILANGNSGWGYAFYITGATELLGNWQTAYKMTYTGNGWAWNDRLPRGIQYKIVRAPWVDGSEISTANVQWEQGPNHEVEFVEIMTNIVDPQF